MDIEYYKDVVVKKNSIKYIEELDKKTLVIYSPTSVNKINIKNIRCRMINWHIITKDKLSIDNYIIQIKDDINKVVALGGGSVIDIGKYISNKLRIRLICIPTMLSTNSYATNKVALIENNKKITIDSKMPDKIIIDNQILKLSMQENIYGLADVLSIFTALKDWKIANEDINENINFSIYDKAKKLLDNVTKFINSKSLEEIKESNFELFNFIGEAGYITNVYGTGRPESGSEHILAKEIEQRVDIPHGISVSVGIIIMSIIQEQYNDEIVKSIMKLRILDKGKNYGLNLKIIADSLNNVKQREDRYTIINRRCKITNINDVLENFENIIKENKVDLN